MKKPDCPQISLRTLINTTPKAKLALVVQNYIQAERFLKGLRPNNWKAQKNSQLLD